MNYLILAALALLALIAWGYNALARMRNVVRTAWADIDVQLKRRAELVPNLVETTKGYSGFERQVLEEVTAARAQSTDDKLPPAQRAEAANRLAGRITQIMAVAEQYPELKSSAHFMALQQELSNTENNLASARQYYNAAVRDYNTMLDTFPIGLLANILQFKRREFFSVDDEQQREPPSAKLTL